MEKFKELGLCEHVLKVISNKKFVKPSEIQEKTIPLILEGKDVIAGSATGSGKTLAFGSGMIRNIEKGRGIQGLVLTPTRELAEQVAMMIEELGYYNPKRKELKLDKEKALDAGCNDYIAKPIKKDVLFNKIYELFNK